MAEVIELAAAEAIGGGKLVTINSSLRFALADSNPVGISLYGGHGTGEVCGAKLFGGDVFIGTAGGALAIGDPLYSLADGQLGDDPGSAVQVGVAYSAAAQQGDQFKWVACLPTAVTAGA